MIQTSVYWNKYKTWKIVYYSQFLQNKKWIVVADKRKAKIYFLFDKPNQNEQRRKKISSVGICYSSQSYCLTDVVCVAHQYHLFTSVSAGDGYGQYEWNSIRMNTQAYTRQRAYMHWQREGMCLYDIFVCLFVRFTVNSFLSLLFYLSFLYFFFFLVLFSLSKCDLLFLRVCCCGRMCAHKVMWVSACRSVTVAQTILFVVYSISLCLSLVRCILHTKRMCVHVSSCVNEWI